MLMNLFILWILMSLFCGSQTAGRTVRFLLGIVVFFWVVRILACFGLIIGNRNLSKCGMMMTVTDAESIYVISVKFEDGRTIANQSYDDFLAGRIVPHDIQKHRQKTGRSHSRNTGKSHIGETGYAIDGMKATIIEWIDKNHIVAKTEDEKTYVLNYSHFLEGKCLGAKDRRMEKDKKSHIGERVELPNGMSAEITEYKNFHDITAKRSDGRIFHLSYDRFCKGKNLGTREDRRDVHIGKRYQLHNGVWVTIIGNNGSNDVAVQTDTGYVKRHLRLQNVIAGRVRIPKEYLFPDADG